MRTLHVRSVPDDLYQQIQSLAQEKNRSLSAQVITLLDQALVNERYREQHTSALHDIRRRRFSPPVDLPDSTELLHGDRSR